MPKIQITLQGINSKATGNIYQVKIAPHVHTKEVEECALLKCRCLVGMKEETTQAQKKGKKWI